MHILIFNWRDLKHTWAGGGEIYIFEQARRWVKKGHKVTLFCGQDVEKKLPSFEEVNGIRIYRKGSRYTVYLWAIWYYFRHLRKNVDVVIDVVNGIPFFTPLFSRASKVCFVYHLHGKQFFYEIPLPLNYIGYVIEKYLFPLFYKGVPIIAISKTTKKDLVKINLNKNNVSIVYCGIDGMKHNIKTVSKFTKPTILYLGRIKKYKRVDLLINIFPKIVERVPNARLIIAGWGTEASSITDMAMKSSLRRKIVLLGPVSESEKKSLLSKSWVFINPSIGEGWGMAVIEANLHGTPAVALDVSGLSESIKNNETGLLAKNEESLVESICKILNDNKLRQKLSRNAIIWANSFNWDRTANESLRILKKIKRKN